MIRSEIRGVALGHSVGKVNRNDEHRTNNEHDALGSRRNDGNQEDEIRSNDPSCDARTGVSQDHTGTDSKVGQQYPLDAQVDCGIGKLGNAGMGDEERQLRLGSDSICLRWLAVAGIPKVGLESIRVALDETRIRGCSCEVREEGTEVDCRLGRLVGRSWNVAKPEWWEIRPIQR